MSESLDESTSASAPAADTLPGYAVPQSVSSEQPSYNRLARVLHWLMAVLIVAMLFLGAALIRNYRELRCAAEHPPHRGPRDPGSGGSARGQSTVAPRSRPGCGPAARRASGCGGFGIDAVRAVHPATAARLSAGVGIGHAGPHYGRSAATCPRARKRASMRDCTSRTPGWPTCCWCCSPPTCARCSGTPSPCATDYCAECWCPTSPYLPSRSRHARSLWATGGRIGGSGVGPIPNARPARTCASSAAAVGC